MCHVSRLHWLRPTYIPCENSISTLVKMKHGTLHKPHVSVSILKYRANPWTTTISKVYVSVMPPRDKLPNHNLPKAWTPPPWKKNNNTNLARLMLKFASILVRRCGCPTQHTKLNVNTTRHGHLDRRLFIILSQLDVCAICGHPHDIKVHFSCFSKPIC